MKSLFAGLLAVMILTGGMSLAAEDGPRITLERLQGDWTGKAAGAEVRFRRQGGGITVMTLTTKHAAEFFFTVREDGTISGEGAILYTLDPDLSGVEALAGAVKGLINLMPMPSVPGAGKVAGHFGDAMTGAMKDVGGVTSPTFSYQMKDAPQQRHFRITGNVYQRGKEWRIRLESTGEYFTGSDLKGLDNQLWVEWEVNRVRETKPFPCWSPFLKSESGDAVIRASEGGSIFLADSSFSGTHRDNVSPWQEYTFTWQARRVAQHP